VGGASSLLAPRRSSALAALLGALVAYYLGRRSLWSASDWWDIAFLAFCLIPAVFALVLLTLPLRTWQWAWRVGLAFVALAVILELVGAVNMSDNLKALAPGGRIAVIGMGAGASAEINFEQSDPAMATAFPEKVSHLPQDCRYAFVPLYKSSNFGEPFISVKRALHNDGIHPPSEFASHCFQNTNLAKPKLRVEADRSCIATIADDGDHLAATLGYTDFNQLGQQ